MTRFWTSDLHVGHENIIYFSSRPFEKDVIQKFALGDAAVTIADVAAMNQALLDNYNSMVSPTDEVWFVGDVVMGHFETNIKFMKRFHGDKYLIPGNHDRCHKMFPKWKRWQAFYEAAGIIVLDSQVMTTVANQSVKVCHFPYRFTHRSDDSYSGQRPDDEGDWLIHGHTHGTEKVDYATRMVHVGVDAWNYFPVSETEVEQIILGIG